MGILRKNSVYDPATRKNPPKRSISIGKKVQLNIQFEDHKKSGGPGGRLRSESVDAKTFRGANRIHELREQRERKAPQRFEPEDFVSKAKVARRRRNSTATAHVSQVTTPQTQRTPAFDMKELEGLFLKFDKMSRCLEKNLPQQKPIETEQFIKSQFPDNSTVVRGEARMLLMKFEEKVGLIHMKPKAKRSVRKVDAEYDLVSSLSIQNIEN